MNRFKTQYGLTVRSVVRIAAGAVAEAITVSPRSRAAAVSADSWPLHLRSVITSTRREGERCPRAGSRPLGESMATVYDRWHTRKPRKDSKTGEPVNPCKHSTKATKYYPSASHGQGDRWQVRWYDESRKQCTRNFDE